MSEPQQYLPGTFYEVTRRCVDRAHKLTPNYARGGTYRSSVEQLYQYATARYAETYSIDVIAVCIMSNHIHEILFDRSGKIAMFLQERNAMLANTVKVRYGLPGGVFERRCEKYNRLEGAPALSQKIAYAIANPVAAGLVASRLRLLRGRSSRKIMRGAAAPRVFGPGRRDESARGHIHDNGPAGGDRFVR